MKKILVLEWLNGQPILNVNFSITPSQKSLKKRKQEITTLLFRALI
ncbi:hypothetical protein ETSB_0803 [cyanobacterium endosymbiont of Epithemia turgida isolate EtSB Lake Yunoko]|nr:hypothetical protein ETSB_0803 [cyanobacterium endosymbiont of Epithemia turgida isolate EtSB Lake Yunoko]